MQLLDKSPGNMFICKLYIVHVRLPIFIFCSLSFIYVRSSLNVDSTFVICDGQFNVSVVFLGNMK